MSTCPTVKIVSDAPGHDGFLIINEEDFDSSVHTLFGDKPATGAGGRFTKKAEPEAPAPAEPAAE